VRISIIGVGYVGLVTGVLFAHLGHDVICVDSNEERIKNLKCGISPIYEPGLDDFIAKRIASGKLNYSTDLADAVHHSEIVFIAVGTPPQPNGATDLSYVEAVAKEIGKALSHYIIVVDKSTVPVGTGALVRKTIRANRTSDILFDVVSNPEFQREGSALHDVLEPDRIVIGADSKDVANKLVELYKPLASDIIITDIESAELIKYASNAFLALKITFANSLANLCEATGANIDDVVRGMGTDKRIGSAFLNAGIGYGGSCFPKDVRSIVYSADEYNAEFKVLKAAIETNDMQPKRFVEKMSRIMGDLRGKKIAALGLAFKKNTDDIRDSRSIEVVKSLLNAGANVTAFDPVAIENTRKVLPNLGYAVSAADAIESADAMAVLTEWDEFKSLNFAEVANSMAGKLVFDGRNILPIKEVERAGLIYYGVGRGNKPAIEGI